MDQQDLHAMGAVHAPVALLPGLNRKPSCLGDATTTVDVSNVSVVSDRRAGPRALAAALDTEADTETESEAGASDDENLHEMLSDLIGHEPLYAASPGPPATYAGYGVLTLELTPGDVAARVAVYKGSSRAAFLRKLKHVFILLLAGKPIYLLHGLDEVIMGYMGLITTIVSAFERDEEIELVAHGDAKIVVMNRAPLVFVAVTKLGYEKMQLRGGDTAASICRRQLDTLYCYLLSITLKPMIAKCFHNRMNYDLRKVLTPLDFESLDEMVMKITYGTTAPAAGHADYLLAFVSELLDLALECVRLTHTTRTRLHAVLLLAKRLKVSPRPGGHPPAASRYLAFAEALPFLLAPPDDALGEDLLFGLLLDSRCKVMAAMKPRRHNLKNEDLKILLATIASQTPQSAPTGAGPDLWIPICMPHFNANGFLYAFVRTVVLAPQIVVIVTLLSSNKNSFFEMQQVATHVAHQLAQKSTTFTAKLVAELGATDISIFRDIKVPQVKHFIYKLRASNQFVTSKTAEFEEASPSAAVSTVLKLVYFYSTLHNTTATPVRAKPSPGAPTRKRLTYIRYDALAADSTVGFMLCSDAYEFYCLCDGGYITTRNLINYSLKIIKWCEKNHKRLFIESGAVF